ncbi:uncharacterized protein BXZ73DRAFT_109153 [Epithele typhae]|uniref:uncharacterized protein n=1 Tax=Epithele typhae TaxID=378194 RepID=UPI00200780D9|nr:uncharacterized protein BXZ73DRAFT_109153 [Epithele typhae]KAH9910325.1 hypothetical protein BXZ73DRAFT_109153 [Epithele typhae]
MFNTWASLEVECRTSKDGGTSFLFASSIKDFANSAGDTWSPLPILQPFLLVDGDALAAPRFENITPNGVRARVSLREIANGYSLAYLSCSHTASSWLLFLLLRKYGDKPPSGDAQTYHCITLKSAYRLFTTDLRARLLSLSRGSPPIVFPAMDEMSRPGTELVDVTDIGDTCWTGREPVTLTFRVRPGGSDTSRTEHFFLTIARCDKAAAVRGDSLPPGQVAETSATDHEGPIYASLAHVFASFPPMEGPRTQVSAHSCDLDHVDAWDNMSKIFEARSQRASDIFWVFSVSFAERSRAPFTAGGCDGALTLHVDLDQLPGCDTDEEDEDYEDSSEAEEEARNEDIEAEDDGTARNRKNGAPRAPTLRKSDSMVELEETYTASISPLKRSFSPTAVAGIVPDQRPKKRQRIVPIQETSELPVESEDAWHKNTEVEDQDDHLQIAERCDQAQKGSSPSITSSTLLRQLGLMSTRSRSSQSSTSTLALPPPDSPPRANRLKRAMPILEHHLHDLEKFDTVDLGEDPAFKALFKSRSLFPALVLATALLVLSTALTFGLAVGFTALGRRATIAVARLLVPPTAPPDPRRLVTAPLLLRALPAGCFALAPAAWLAAVLVGWRAQWRVRDALPRRYDARWAGVLLVSVVLAAGFAGGLGLVLVLPEGDRTPGGFGVRDALEAGGLGMGIVSAVVGVFGVLCYFVLT